MKLFFNQHRLIVFIVALIVFGSSLRLYQLGSVPQGLGWDEAAIGYNGWSIWTTRRDEWLNRLPVSFRSFGDYKAPLAIYLNGPFTLLFGMNAFAVRLPFALLACATLAVWWRLLELIRQQTKLSQWFVVFGVASLAFSPWHIVFSRVAFESVIALFFVILGLWMTLLGLTLKQRTQLFFVLSAMSFVASLYTYHSAKIVVPLLLLLLLWLWFKEILMVWKPVVLSIMVTLLASAPLVFDSIFGLGSTRAGALIFFSNDTWQEMIIEVGSSLRAHSNPAYLFLGKGDELRHTTGIIGPILPGTMIWMFLSFFSKRSYSSKKYYALGLGLLLIGMIPGLISATYPHANRTLLALPGFLLLASFGLENILAKLTTTKQELIQGFFGMLLIVDILWALSFSNVYFHKYVSHSADAFQAGYQNAVRLASQSLSGTNPVERVILSSSKGQPYIFVLFFNAVNPIAYHQGALINYLFPDKVTVGDLARQNSLLIFTDNDPIIQEEKSLNYSPVSDLNPPSFYYYRTP